MRAMVWLGFDVDVKVSLNTSEEGKQRRLSWLSSSTQSSLVWSTSSNQPLKMRSQQKMTSPMLSVLGDIVTLSVSNVSHPFTAVRDALIANGFESGVAREIKPRGAFGRAARALSKNRIIRKTKEEKDEIEFQFTKEVQQSDKTFDYPLEAMVRLDKSTGRVMCYSDSALEAKAQSLVDEHLGSCSGGDISRIAQRILEQGADLVPLMKRSRSYFVPEMYSVILERVAAFVTAMGGELCRFAVARTGEGEIAVHKILAEHLRETVKRYKESVLKLDESTRSSTYEKRLEKAVQLKMKIDAYSEFLKSEREELELGVDEARNEVYRRMNSNGETSQEITEVGRDEPVLPGMEEEASDDEVESQVAEEVHAA